jgi:hypothetical protein
MDTFTQNNQGFLNGQNSQNFQKTNAKIGKRISKNDLLVFIENNKEIVKNINYVDLNDPVDEIDTNSIEQVNIQSIVEIRYLPDNLSLILKPNINKYSHTGCLKTIKSSNKNIIQISLLSSIITCLHYNFSILSLQNQLTFMTKVFERLKNESAGSKFTEFRYFRKYRWNKHDIETDFNNSSCSVKVLKYLSDYFHINIFILDIEKDDIFFTGNEFIPHKNSVFLLKYSDDVYEPLFLGNLRFFSVDSYLINYIRKNPNIIKVMPLNGEDIDSFKEEIYNGDNNIVIEKIEYKLSDVKVTLKLDELKTMAKNLGINCEKKTKSVLIDEIKKLIK